MLCSLKKVRTKKKSQSMQTIFRTSLIQYRIDKYCTQCFKLISKLCSSYYLGLNVPDELYNTDLISFLRKLTGLSHYSSMAEMLINFQKKYNEFSFKKDIYNTHNPYAFTKQLMLLLQKACDWIRFNNSPCTDVPVETNLYYEKCV